MFLTRIFRKNRQYSDEIDNLLAAFNESYNNTRARSEYEAVVHINLPDGTTKEHRTNHKTSEEAEAVLNRFKIGDELKIDDNTVGIVNGTFLRTKMYNPSR